MDTTYYRKIAEILVREEPDGLIKRAAERVLAARNPRRSDKRKMKAWMYTWIDRRLEVSIEVHELEMARLRAKVSHETNCRVPGGRHRYVDNVCIWCDAEQGV